ncbi:hypothetical protein [Mobiluncus mulieris]|uniref:hypothetical protein n=1 Tax=Mobiluncus mulieris TaxID=2052 RepID=UPI0021E31FEE|nr:hypothetical protein [Mobiluncus mulieris]
MPESNYEMLQRAAGWPALPAWTQKYNCRVPLFEDIYEVAILGVYDRNADHFIGGHGSGCLKDGGGKSRHTEFPAGWKREKLRQAYYYLLAQNPDLVGHNLVFMSPYDGVLVRLEFPIIAGFDPTRSLHFFPIKGRGVRCWVNGVEIPVGQKRQK